MSPNSDFEELLRTFRNNGVKYLIVGGYALMLYTEPRHTKDLDLWIEASEENAQKVFRALAAFGAPLSGMSAKGFAQEGFFYQLGMPPVRVDILMSIDGLSFSEGRQDLIKNKLATGRHIDLHDVEQLRKAGPS